MKIVLIVTKSISVINFRKKMIEKLKKDNNDIYIIAQDDVKKNEIEKLGVCFYCVTQDNRGKNPFSMYIYEKRMKSIIKKICPDVVFTFQMKPNIFGVKAAKSVGVNSVFSMVEGLGDVFIKNSLKWKIVRFVSCRLYKSSFRYCKKVFFLNSDDKKDFVNNNLVNEDKCILIPGIGVDLNYFSFKEIRNTKKILMIARMLKTKGVYEYLELAKRIKQIIPDAQFNYLGAEGDITLDDIKEYIDNGIINYLGTTDDVRPYIEESNLIILPSYREGVPMSIMEAMSIGRPIITFDTVGCRETVLDGYNGYLIEFKNINALVEKTLSLIEDFNLAKEFGKNSRKMAEEKFDSNEINETIITIIHNYQK